MNKSLLLIFSLLFIYSCQYDPKDQKTGRILVDSAKKKIDTAPEMELNNIYTKISDSLCMPLQISDFKYTNKNTEIYFLDPHDSLGCFVFQSEFACGFPGGSCGDNIEVIKKKGDGYYAALSTCGFVNNVMNEQNDGILSFIYRTQDGYKIKVYWTGDEFAEDNISVNNIEYKYIMRISAAMRRDPVDFMLYNPEQEIGDKLAVSIEDIAIGRNKIGKLYKVATEKYVENFLFDNNPEKPAIILSKRGDFRFVPQPVPGGDYYDIVTTADDGGLDKTVTLWKYDRHRKKYIPGS